MDEGVKNSIGADQLVATDDDNAVANLPMLDVAAEYGQRQDVPNR